MSGNNERILRVVVAGEDRGASKTLNDVEKSASKVDPAAKSASTALGGIKSSLVNLVPGGQQAESALSKVTGSGESLGGALSGALVGGAAAGAAALVSMSVKGVGAMVDLAKQTSAYQRVAGGTTEQASSMVVVFREMGIDSDAGAKAMARLGREVATGGSTLAQYGVEVARNKNGTADLNGTLLNVVDAYNATSDAAQRDAIAQAAFGKAGIALQPILAKGREGLDELTKAAKKHGEVLNDQSKNQALAYVRAQRDMTEAVNGFEMQLGQGLIPKLTESTKSLSGFIDMVNTATKPIGGLGGVLGQIVSSPLGEAWGEMSDVLHGKAPIWESTADHAKRLKDEQEKAAKATQDASAASETDAASSQRLADADKAAADAVRARTKAIDELATAQAEAIDKDLAARDAVKSMTDSITDYNTKTKDATEAVKDHGAKSQDAKIAQQALQEQTNKTAGDIVHFAEITRDAQAAQAAATTGAWDASQKNDALRGALQGVANQLAPGSPLRNQLDGYIASLKSTPDNVKTVAIWQDQEAKAAYLGYKNALENNPPVITPEVDLSKVTAALQSIGRIFRDASTPRVDVNSSVTRALNAGVR